VDLLSRHATTMTVQYGLVALQLMVLIGFAFAAFSESTAPPPLAFDLAWFNPFGVESFSAFAAGLSLSIFIFWGWDVCLTVSEESVGSEEVPGKAATWTVMLILACTCSPPSPPCSSPVSAKRAWA
jgi:hypothetical protein